MTDYEKEYKTPAPRYTSPAAAPQGQPTYVPPPPKPLHTSNRRDVIAAAVLMVLAILAGNWSLYGGFHLGYAVSFLALTLLSILYLGKGTLRPRPYAILCLLAGVAGVGIFLWHNDGLLKFFAFCGMELLLMLALCDASGQSPRGSGRVDSLLDALSMLFRPFRHMGAALPALFRVERDGNIQKRRCGGVFVGLLCAIPALVVLVPLLMKADAAFAGLIKLTIFYSLGEWIVSLLVGLILFCWIFSRLYSLRHNLPQPSASAPQERKGADALAVNVFLGVIAGVYLLYLFSQLAYFISGFSGILPSGYTVAEYARQGFFEMCVVCAINLGLVGLILLISHRPEAPTSTRAFLFFILTFSLVLVATALSKMVLYVGSFGMTRLRVLTAIFMVMLAVVILLLAIRMFAPRFPYMRIAVLTLAVIGLGTGYLDVDTRIANYNVAAFQAGKLKTVDVAYLANLGDGAVPALFKLYDGKDATVKAESGRALHRKLLKVTDYVADGSEELAFTKEMSLRNYCIDTARARRLLWEHRKELLRYATVTEEDTSYGYNSSSTADKDFYPQSYAEQQLVKQLGQAIYSQNVNRLGEGDDYELYRIYEPEQPDESTFTIGSYRIRPVYMNWSNQGGLYVVLWNSGTVCSLADAYTMGAVDVTDMHHIYFELLPEEMRGGVEKPQGENIL